MIDEEKRAFTTFDSLSVLLLLFLGFGLVGSIITNTLVDQKEKIAFERTHQLAVQIAAGGYKGLQDEAQIAYGIKERLPASSQPKVDIKPEGRIGMDPWGMPYYYVVREDHTGNRIVAVLSSGPNRSRESEEELNPQEKFPLGHYLVHGDVLVSYAKR
jgi:hypothetical protein